MNQSSNIQFLESVIHNGKYVIARLKEKITENIHNNLILFDELSGRMCYITFSQILFYFMNEDFMEYSII